MSGEVFLPEVLHAQRFWTHHLDLDVDLPRAQVCGLREAAEVLSDVEGLKFVHFDERDVVRHHLVQKIICAYDRFERQRDERAAAAAARTNGNGNGG